MTAFALTPKGGPDAPGVAEMTFEVPHGGRRWTYAVRQAAPELIAAPRDGEGAVLDPPESVVRAAEATARAAVRASAGFTRRQDALADLRHVGEVLVPLARVAIRGEVPGARRAAAELRTWLTRRRAEPGTSGDLRAALEDLDRALARALEATRRTAGQAAPGATPETRAHSGHRAVAGLIAAGSLRADSPEAKAAAEIGELLRFLPLQGVPRTRPLDDVPRGGGAALGPGGYQGLPGDLDRAHRTRYRPWLAEARGEIVRTGDEGDWSAFDLVRRALLDGWSLRDLDAAMGARKGTAKAALLAALRAYAARAGWG